MVNVYHNLVKPTNDANAGHLVGNRNFYSNDYMVSGNTNNQTIHSDAFLGSAWFRLCLHA
jgi:hypothetical protein